MTTSKNDCYLTTLMDKERQDVGAEPKSLTVRMSGRFYTNELVAQRLITTMLSRGRHNIDSDVHIVEPFSGDGRLVVQFLQAAAMMPNGTARRYHVELWDCDGSALAQAERNVIKVAQALGLDVRTNTRFGNTFLFAQDNFGCFDVCITNPPWETLKPDRRELAQLSPEVKEKHIRFLRQYDQHLAELYPLSSAQRKFSGWGTNLARCGTELALRLVRPHGICGLVIPSSLLADQVSERLRCWMLREFMVSEISFYPAELRLFQNVDQTFVTLVAEPGDGATLPPNIVSYQTVDSHTAVEPLIKDWQRIVMTGSPVPLQFANQAIELDTKLEGLPMLQDWRPGRLWTGRELDETGHQKYLSPIGDYLFCKGRMVGRYEVVEVPHQHIHSSGPRIPKTADQPRIVWRDVARPTQKRRIKATIIPAGWVTGNSLSVACLQGNDGVMLKALLAVMNSFVFEAQVRSRLSTGHISVGAVRQSRVPVLTNEIVNKYLAMLVDQVVAGHRGTETRLEVRVARVYGLTKDDFSSVLTRFPKVEPAEVTELLESTEWEAEMPEQDCENGKVYIPNHYSASLSALDVKMALAVPPGGNWKHIPEDTPSQRVKQIRESYAKGGGSRSTYYGRLAPDEPAYTINTHFCRPGNGCHLHYDYDGKQHRVLSQREAARLQSFPDDYIFSGSRNAVNQQIGNAVPPLLAYQVARSLPYRGRFVDLFSGAGGLALGFVWAGWEPIIANDIVPSYLETYRRNIHDSAVCGDIREEVIFDAIVQGCTKARQSADTPLFVLGGPPCQGFSTAGNKRSMDDERNWLFRQYRAILDAVCPSGFLFENVTGLLSMDQGRVFQMVQEELRPACKTLSVWKVNAEEYGVPQRRTRIMLFGDNYADKLHPPPLPVTSHIGKKRRVVQEGLFGSLPTVYGVRDALNDLPPLSCGEDGSCLNYVSEPLHPYQMLMRGRITAEEYLTQLE